MNFNLKKILPHVAAVAVFVILLLIYFQPVTEGYKLRQHDNTTFKGISKEIRDYRAKFGEEPLWTNTAFGGMPATLISVQFNNNWMNHIQRAMELWLPHPINLVFVCMLGFYILFLCLRVNPWLAIVGGIAFGFSTYNFLIIEAGHNTKAYAIAWMPAVIGAIIYTYRNNALWGAALTMLFMALEIRANHLQVTYYLMMIVVFYGLFELVQFFQKGELKKFLIRTAFVLGGVFLAVLPNYSMLKSITQIAGETTRSESKLTIKADGTPNTDNKTSGLDRKYITDYSYGKIESLNLVIPNAVGAMEAIGAHEDLLTEITNPQIAQKVAESPSYWSDESNGGPTYLGAVAFTLFLLSFLFLKDITKWGFLFIGILGLLLAWGKNSPGLTDFFIDSVPGYNKFRAVTIILVILQVIVPMLGIWGIHALVTRKEEFKQNIKKFYIAAGAIVALFLFVMLAGSSFAFLSTNERQMFSEATMKAAGNVQEVSFYNELKSGLVNARKSLFFADAIRSFLYAIGTLLVVLLFIRGVLNQLLMYGIIGLLVLIDMWGINMRFLNNEPYPNSEEYQSWVLPENQEYPFSADPADYAIFQREANKQPQLLTSIAELERNLQQEKENSGAENIALTAQESDQLRFRELNFATNYRVLNVNNPFNDGRTSYFHKSIGGYHGAKQKRIQEIIEFHYSKELQRLIDALNSGDIKKIGSTVRTNNVLNMMNTKYIVFNPRANGAFEIKWDTILPATAQPGILLNDCANGNAWFVNKIQEVKNDDEEITALSKFNLRHNAIMQKEMIDKIGATASSGKGTIKLKEYRPNKFTYECESNGENVAVFSEIYSDYNWKVKIDGQETKMARANYILRAIKVPSGKHTIEFYYDSSKYKQGETISLTGSVLVVLFFAFALYRMVKTNKEEETKKEHPEVID